MTLQIFIWHWITCYPYLFYMKHIFFKSMMHSRKGSNLSGHLLLLHTFHQDSLMLLRCVTGKIHCIAFWLRAPAWNSDAETRILKWYGNREGAWKETNGNFRSLTHGQGKGNALCRVIWIRFTEKKGTRVTSQSECKSYSLPPCESGLICIGCLCWSTPQTNATPN